MTGVEAARRVIAGSGLKLRFRRDGSGFAITERVAPLGSGIGWYAQGEFALIALRRSGGLWRIRHYDGKTWAKPDAVVEEDDIERTVRELVGNMEDQA